MNKYLRYRFYFDIFLVMKQVLIFLLILLGGFVYSQTVLVSDEILLRNDYSYDILGLYDGRTLLFRNKIYKQEIQVFDEKMNMIREKELNLEDRKTNIIGVVGDEGYFSVVYSYRRRGDVFVSLAQFDGDLMPVDSSIIVDMFENQLLTPEFDYVRSEDRSKVLVYTTDRDDEMDILVIDLESRTPFWKNKFVLNNTNLRREFRNIAVTNTGEMFLLLDKSSNFFESNDPSIEILHYDQNVRSAQKVNVSLGDHYSNDISFDYDNLNDCITVVGLYSTKSYGRSNGVYFFRYFPGEEAPPVEYLDFPERTLLDVYGKSVNDDKGIADIQIQDIILREDGGMLLINEIKKEYSRRPYYTERTYYGSSFNYQTDFHYEDLIVCSIHPDGQHHWNTVLHKKQFSHDDNAIYSSFFIFKSPSKLRLIYNDEISRENTVSEYVIKGNGELIRNSLMSTEYQNLQLRFKDAVQVSNTEFIVPSQRQLKLNLVKIDYR